MFEDWSSLNTFACTPTHSHNEVFMTIIHMSDLMMGNLLRLMLKLNVQSKSLTVAFYYLYDDSLAACITSTKDKDNLPVFHELAHSVA